MISLVNEIIFNNSNKDCDWLILACFVREQYTADATFSPLENKVWFENSANAWGHNYILYHKTNKQASTVLCSAVKHLGRSRALEKFVLYRFLRTLQQDRAQSRLFYLLSKKLLRYISTKRSDVKVHMTRKVSHSKDTLI